MSLNSIERIKTLMCTEPSSDQVVTSVATSINPNAKVFLKEEVDEQSLDSEFESGDERDIAEGFFEAVVPVPGPTYRPHEYPPLPVRENVTGTNPYTRPLLGVCVTGYRLLNTALVVAFGVPKALASYRGETLATTLDLVSGVVVAAIMFWVGCLDSSGDANPTWPWFFRWDYARVVWVHIASTESRRQVNPWQPIHDQTPSEPS
ncbi:hypothetical protein OF83DRAFT_1168869 [Amylostereum chailletii]|nr:hypothetical protein OF83DRAFT_1168869 [Amylostereum chailletii]